MRSASCEMKWQTRSSGTTILLHDGTYDLSSGDGSSRLSFETANVTLRSLSGNRDAVVLDGNYGTSELVSISASNVTIADLTLMRASNHPIHISGLAGNPISGILIHNLRIVDPREQAIKVNPIDDGYVDNSTIECCSIELTDVGRTHVNPDFWWMLHRGHRRPSGSGLGGSPQPYRRLLVRHRPVRARHPLLEVQP